LLGGKRLSPKLLFRAGKYGQQTIYVHQFNLDDSSCVSSYLAEDPFRANPLSKILLPALFHGFLMQVVALAVLIIITKRFERSA